MNIVFYSTNSNFYNSNSMTIKTFPAASQSWSSFGKNHQEHNFTIVLQKPGMFLLDKNKLISDEKQFDAAPNVHFIIPDENQDTAENIAELIASLKPDLACSITYWTNPFDWLSIKDGLIGELLSEKGIKTVSHGSEEALLCFDKIQTSSFLHHNGFNAAKGIPVHHELFWAERNKLEIRTNIYKEYVFEKIRRLNFPVVVKDTTGLSSFGMDVCKTFNEARHVLTSKKNNGDRLVEEFLDGESFGAEIYGSDGNYLVSPVLINSVNQFGLTSPKQNVKLGPVLSPNFQIESLKSELIRLAKLLNLQGIAQVDLVFHEKKWYIIEINSRISGMTQTIARSLGLSLYELIFMACCSFEKSKSELENRIKTAGFVMNMKFPLLSEEKLEKLFNLDFISEVNQIENNEAKQLREAGYSEVILTGSLSLQGIVDKLETLKNNFPDEIEPVFYKNALKLAETIKF